MLATTTTFVAAHILIFTGLFGLVVRRHNLVISLICLEMALLGVALFFVAVSHLIGSFWGDLFFFYLLTLAGVESALGLAIIIMYYRTRTIAEFSSIVVLKG